MAIEFPSGYTSREYQDPFFYAMGAGMKRAVLVWHRRAGKDLSAWNWIITEAYRRTGIYYYFFPTYAQGKKVIWDGMDNAGKTFLHYIPNLSECRLNETEMQITLPATNGGSNGSIIQIIGTDKMDSIVGTNPIGCVFSEYALQNPRAWSLTRPILEANGGWAVFVYTPRGSNHAKVLWDKATLPENAQIWYTQKLTIRETKQADGTPVISEEQIEQMRREGEDEDLIQQEYYVSFSGAQQGAYYSRLVGLATEEGRIRPVPFDPILPVDTFWDIGRGDSTVIGFRQLYGGDCRWIDCYEAKNEGLPHFSSIISERARLRGYRYGRHYFPHDMQVTEWGTNESRLAAARRMGLRPASIVPKLPFEHGIDAVRRRFNRYYFDEIRCVELVRALSEYARKYNKTTSTFGKEPDHNWASHFADMIRYEAVTGDVPTDYDIEKLPKAAMTHFNPLGDYEESTGRQEGWYDPFDTGGEGEESRGRARIFSVPGFGPKVGAPL